MIGFDQEGGSASNPIVYRVPNKPLPCKVRLPFQPFGVKDDPFVAKLCQLRNGLANTVEVVNPYILASFRYLGRLLF